MHTNPFKFLFLSIFIALSSSLAGQTDTSLSLLDDEIPVAEKVQNSFKTTKVVNLQSLEVTDAGVFDFKINHRFGQLNSGLYNLFGLDQATMRIGGEYGIVPNLMVGVGRNTWEKTLDGYLKYRLMHQTTDNKKPLSILVFTGIAKSGNNVSYPITNIQRLSYTSQIIIGRKFTDGFSMQLSPTWVHHNIAAQEVDNDLYALGIGFRQKITNRTTINVEYIPVFGNKGMYKNSLSIGCDIETGGHVFQLHVTNSSPMFESGYIARSTGDWTNGGIMFGFNIARVFTVVNPSRFKNNSY